MWGTEANQEASSGKGHNEGGQGRPREPGQGQDAQAAFIGKSNYNAALLDTKTTTSAKADTATTVSCRADPLTYIGSALTPCFA